MISICLLERLLCCSVLNQFHLKQQNIYNAGDSPEFSICFPFDMQSSPHVILAT